MELEPEMNKKYKGPSCFGTVMLFCAIVLILRYAYSHIPAGEGNTEDIDGGKEPEITLYNEIYNGLKAYSTELTFGYDCTAELFDTYERVCGDHPELFWAGKSGTYEKRTAGEDVSVTFYVNTDLTLVEILRYRNELNEKKDAIIGGIHDGMTDYEKILYVHDVLVSGTEYDSVCADAVRSGGECDRLWQSSSAYGCLVNGLAICSGYSAAFQLLLNEIGVECIRVSGHELANNTAHEWNCVNLGGRWYYVDVTWDDPIYESEDSIFRGSISHEYFMISEDSLTKTHEIGEEENVPICDDDAQGYYRRNGVYLEAYDFASAAPMIEKQLGNDMIEIEFSDAENAEAAVNDLFGEYRFYDIEGVNDLGGVSVTYSLGNNGLLRIAVMDPEM